MKKLIYTVALLLAGAGLEAQNFWRDYPFLNVGPASDSLTHYVSTEGMFSAGCDGVNNEFLIKLYRGGYMDSMFIDKSSRALLPVNRFGATTTVGITYGFPVNDSTGEAIHLSLLRRNNITGRFSDDAFHLAFQGNTRYKGEEADFGSTRFTSMSWTQLRFGYVTPQKQGGLIFSFSVIAGHHYNEANIRYGKLFTDSLGLSLDGGVAADYWSSDTSNHAAFALNGWGTSVDVTWMKYWTPQQKELAAFTLDFIDFGFINWNSKTIHRYTDTTFEYNGVDVTPYFVDADYVAELPEDDDFIRTDTSDFHRSLFLPAVARASFRRTFLNTRLSTKASFAMPFWSEALPYGSLTASWIDREQGYAITGGIAYGGYARVQVPFKIELFMIRRFSLEAGTPNLLGFFNAAKTSGYGGVAKLSYCF